VNHVLAGSGWGWHIETAIHVIRLVLGGVFDRFPKLQIVVGHLGEGLPFMLPRLDRNFAPALTKLQRGFGDYLRQNVHYTFGGFNFPATFLDLLLEVGVDRIMFSTDYPYGSMAPATEFLHSIPATPQTASASPTATPTNSCGSDGCESRSHNSRRPYPLAVG
jgi:predicted TIM-barrel fold metal-dependent hydrolase